jgi:hypothetical protein
MTVPVPAVLDLWCLGHSAGWIGAALDLHPKKVTKIVAQARRVGDQRAVLHADKNGRLIGRAGHEPCLAAVEVVPFVGGAVIRRRR